MDASWCFDKGGVLVALFDHYTQAERTLIESGRFSAVRSTRDTLHRGMEAELRHQAQELTQREVIAVVNQVVEQPQVACIVFLLGASR